MAISREVLEIRLLGGFSVHFEQRPVPPLPSRTARLLFAWLALQVGRPQPRSLLADRFWPDMPESRARRRLSHALWQIQDSLSEASPAHSYLVVRGDDVAFDAQSPYWLDVEEFEQRLDHVDRAETVDAAAVRSLRQSVELYQGELLAGSYEPWVVEEQERLRQRYVTALGRLVDASKQRGHFDEALTFAQRLTHEAPLREDVHREVMRLCVLLGQQSQALEQFERCRSVLREELGTQPSAETLQLRERITQVRDVSVSRRIPGDQLVSRRLVGRDEHRVALVDQMERTLAGITAMVLVEGEPGIGKSQLLAQAADDARWRGFSVLWGTCAGSSSPYSALREAVEPELDAVRVAQLRAHVDGVWLQEASRLLPSLRGASAHRPAKLDGADAAQRMQEALVQVLDGLAAVEPVMLVIEDAHHADHETLELIRALGRQVSSSRLLVVLTFRDADARADEMVWPGLRAVDRDARPMRLKLEPLSAFETAGLLREVLHTSEVPTSFAAQVHRESGGNPLYALELLRALRDAGSLRLEHREHLEALPVPVTDGLRTVIADRLEYLDEQATEVVELAAVIGAEFGLDTLRAGLQIDARELTDAVADLVRRNLLDLSGQACRFTHAATRRVVLLRLEDQRRRSLHAAAAEALEQTAADQVEELAAHFREADLPQRAVPYLVAAADRALELHAYSTARQHLASAAELSAHTVRDVDSQFELYRRLEHVLGVLGSRDEQAVVLDELDALAGEDQQRHVEVLVLRATYLAHVDQFATAIDAAVTAVSLAQRLGEPLRGRALAALGQVRSWAGDNAQAAEDLAQACDQLVSAPVEQAQARFGLGAALRAVQRFDEARIVLEQALTTAQDHDHQVGVIQALGAMADLDAETGRTVDATARYEQAVELARQVGYRHREGVGLVNLGTLRLSAAQPLPSLAAYDQAVTVFEGLGNRRGIAMVQLNRAWLHHRWLGQHEQARRDALAAYRYFHEVGHRALVAVSLETLAAIARHEAEWPQAADQLSDALVAAEEAHDQRAVVQVLRGTAEVELATGRIDAAATTLQRAAELVDDLGVTEFVAEVASLRSLVALKAGDDVGAWRLAEQAAGSLAAGSEPHRVHARLAHVAAAAGQPDRAAHHQVQAYEILMNALDGADEKTRQHAVDNVDEHRAIVAVGRNVAPRTMVLSMARQDAPRGRALTDAETLPVRLQVVGSAQTPDDRRRQIVEVLGQVDAQGAEATVHDLAEALGVSPSTIRRDLRDLRQQGFACITRGSIAG